MVGYNLKYKRVNVSLGSEGKEAEQEGGVCRSGGECLIPANSNITDCMRINLGKGLAKDGRKRPNGVYYKVGNHALGPRVEPSLNTLKLSF